MLTAVRAADNAETGREARTRLKKDICRIKARKKHAARPGACRGLRRTSDGGRFSHYPHLAHGRCLMAIRTAPVGPGH